MSEALYAEHPEVYDVLYAGKEYDEEVAFVMEQFDEHGNGGDRALVVGCGTSEHSRRLVDAGFDVTGVDRYEAMVERARTKSDAEFHVATLPELPVAGPYDLVWLPFTVVNHLAPDDLAASFRAIGDVLADGGMVVFDAMHAAAMTDGPSLQCQDGPDGEYARLTEVHEAGDDRYAWHSIVFTPDDGFFVDTHDLVDYDPEFLDGLASAVGLSVERFGWYDAGDGDGEDGGDDDVTFVAWDG